MHAKRLRGVFPVLLVELAGASGDVLTLSPEEAP